MAEKATKKKVKITSAQKRCLQNVKRAKLNKVCRTDIHTKRVTLDKLITAKSEDAKSALDTVFSKVDKAVKLGVYKPNKAARIKSRASKKLNAIKA